MEFYEEEEPMYLWALPLNRRNKGKVEEILFKRPYLSLLNVDEGYFVETVNPFSESGREIIETSLGTITEEF